MLSTGENKMIAGLAVIGVPEGRQRTTKRSLEVHRNYIFIRLHGERKVLHRPIRRSFVLSSPSLSHLLMHHDSFPTSETCGLWIDGEFLRPTIMDSKPIQFRNTWNDQQRARTVSDGKDSSAGYEFEGFEKKWSLREVRLWRFVIVRMIRSSVQYRSVTER